MKIRLNLLLKAAILCVNLLTSFSLWSQVTVEFRILSVTSDISDMDPAGADDSDPTWYYEITDVPFGNFGSGTTALPETNCPGTTVVNDVFYSQNFTCDLPTQYDFLWYAYEADGAPMASDGYTGNQTVTIPAASINVPQAAWTTLGTYNASGVAINCAAGPTTTWSLVLQYRTTGALDTQAPTVTSCPGNVSQSSDPGVCTATLDPNDPVFADNCAVTEVTWNMTGATVGSSPGSGINYVGNTAFNVGTTTITYTARDAQGNSNNTCSFTVTISDNENPTITCPGNQSVNSAAGNCSAVVNGIAPVSTGDNCGVTVQTWALTGATIANSPGAGINDASGQTFNVGVTTVTYTVQDAAGNSANCSFTVTVTDNESPTFTTCPANISQNVDPGLCTATLDPADPVYADNCGVTTLTWTMAGATVGSSPLVGINTIGNTTFNEGVTTITYTATDAASNSNTCVFSVTITDNINPTITCPAGFSQNVDPGMCNAVVNGISPVSTGDNCGVTAQTWTMSGATIGSSPGVGINDASGQTFNVGVTTVEYTVQDAQGNSASCIFNITIIDNENPTITCPADIIVNNDPGLCTKTITYATPVGTDNCPGATTTMTAGLASGSAFPVGTTVVTYEVTDGSGNTASCSFNVTVNDVQNPSITCPANITQNNDPGSCDAIVNYVAPVGTDNCPGAVTALTAGLAPGSAFPVGTTVVTYQVTDASGNTANCSFNVTVNDTENPTISCPANIVVNNDPGICGATVNYVTPVGTDNCPGAVTNLIAGQASGTIFPIGTTTVTYEVIDASGNSAQCSFDVTVNDAENPTITCPADIVVSNDPGVCGAVVNYVAPVGADNCPGSVTVMTGGLVSGALFPIGTTVVTYEVTDASGNTASCSFNVTVNDTQLPSISCPANITQSNDPGVCGATINYVTPVGTDNCPGATTTMTAGQASGTIFPIGTTTVTYEVTDASGNTAQCSFDVTVNDTENPTISCPTNITVNNDPGICGATINYVTPIGSDNCPGSVTTMIAGQASGTVFPIGTTIVTYEVTDASGNTAQCSFSVTVNDTENPTISCPANITVSNDAGICGATVNYVTPVGTDNCPGSVTSLIAGQASGTLFPIGTTTVTYEVTDASGNTAQCSFDVTVNDTENPTISCPANITVSNDPALCGAVVNYVTPVGADNCPGSTTTLIAGQASGTVFPIGTTTVTYQVTDASGNTAQCSFDVTVNDTENPTISCPANITQNNDPGVCGAIVNYVTPVGSDNCPGATTTMIAGQASGTLFSIGTTTVTYQVTDASGNTAQCSFDVTVNDTENPTISCPADITINNDPGLCGATVNYVTPVGSDNCPGATTTMLAGQASGTVFPIGTTTVTYQVTDASGNTAQCSFNVTVNDTENPTISCPANITVSNDAGVCGAIVNYVTPVGSDNCPGSTTTMIAGQATGTLFPIGTTTVTYQVTDASGNTAQCSFDVTVNDTESPTISCPANITVSNDPGLCGATVNYVTPVGSDNCPGSTTTMTAGQASGTVFPIGTTTVTYQVTDASGNTAQCSFDVTVNDTENPTISCPVNITQNNDPGVCGATVNYVTPVGSDNCPGSTTAMIAGQASGTVFPIGTTTVTYQVTDASGNTSQCSFDVTVIDTENPTISCPANITVSNDPGLCGAVVNYVTPVGSDNCPGATTTMLAGQASGTVFPVGTTTVIYEVTDASGNAVQCSFDITVNDTENPTISCSSNITVSNDAGACGAIVNYSAPVTSDNCPGSTTTLIAGQASGTFFPIGTTTVTYEIVDASGNTAQCSFDVTVNDTENPTILCPANITVSNDPGLCGATVNYVTPVGSDNCPGSTTTMIAGQASGTVFPIGTTVVTYEVTDASGNSTQCSFNVTVNDTENPTIVCPADITVTNDPGVCGATVTYVTPVGADNCPGSTTTMIAGQASGTVFPIGTTTVTYQVTDASGNSVQCSFDVTVNDTENPTISCPADITVSNIPNVCGATVNYVAPVGSDNCPGSTTVMTSGLVSGALFPVGTTIQTFEVTDASGNTAQCSFTITVNDTQNPVINCPSNITVSNDPGQCGAIVNFVPPTGGDNCPGATTILISGLPPGSFFPVGTTTQIYEVTDASGNTSQCSFDVTVNDTEVPVITCPADIIVNNDPGLCGATVTYITPVGSDNCPAAVTNLIVGQSSGSFFPVGTTTVVYEVTDASGNTAQCSFDVTVIDAESPTITCPANITQPNDPGVCGAIVNYTTPTGSDNCPGSTTTLIAGLASGSLFPVGTTTVTYEVTDAAGNTAQCSFDVTIQDTENPTITCPSNITVGNDPGVCGANVTYATPTGLDNCPGSVTTLIAGQASGTIFPIGVTTVTYEVTDAAGNTSQCSFDITVNDIESPSLTCPADQFVNFNGSCQFILLDYTFMAANSDNCSVVSVTQSPAPGTAINGTTTITITAVDPASNSTNCSFDVIPSDNTPPVITSCPSDQNEYVDVTCKYAVPNYTGLVTGSDNCGTFNVTQSPSAGSAISTNTTVILTVDDGNGNSSSCNFNILLSDTISPSISCPPGNIDVYFNANCEYIIVPFDSLTSAFDNCGTTNISQNPPVGTAITGNQTMTMTVTDASGNTGQCQFNLVPQDTIAPTIGCPGNQVAYLNDTCYAVVGDYTGLANTTANCEAVIVTQDPLPGTVVTNQQTIVLFGEDASGNVSACTFNMTVTDTIRPQITCPPDIYSCSNVVTFTVPTATDNCGPITVTRITGLPSGSTFPDGPTLMTYVAEDAYGNTDTCTFTINVFVKPEGNPTVSQISCFGDKNGAIDLTVNAGNPPFSYQWSNSAVTEDISGLDTGTYWCIITDSEGCVDTVTATITEPDSLWIDETITHISCWGETDGEISVMVNGGTFPYSYSWSTPLGAGVSAQNLPAGTYAVNVTDNRGCTLEESYTIIEPDSITIDAELSLYSSGYNISVEGGSDGWIELFVSGGNSPYNYSWDIGGSTEFVSGLPAGTYSVIVTDDNGCTQEGTYILEEPLAPVLFSGFSPNGDGYNDLFKIENIERYPNNKLTIMNRWGDVVYQKSGYNNEWDGTPNTGIVMYGNMVPEGSYYYVFEMVEGSDSKVTGYIVIKR
ncbi:MAG: HYR domain-containing protein [Crocinitomicaceae bacterium]|nr:HYR domain-containing protein [Crocinitomicaceae bacterium]